MSYNYSPISANPVSPDLEGLDVWVSRNMVLTEKFFSSTNFLMVYIAES